MENTTTIHPEAAYTVKVSDGPLTVTLQLGEPRGRYSYEGELESLAFPVVAGSTSNGFWRPGDFYIQHVNRPSYVSEVVR